MSCETVAIMKKFNIDVFSFLIKLLCIRLHGSTKKLYKNGRIVFCLVKTFAHRMNSLKTKCLCCHSLNKNIIIFTSDVRKKFFTAAWLQRSILCVGKL